MNRVLLFGTAALTAWVLSIDLPAHGGKESASIKVVMQKSMKGNLTNRVANGIASAEDKKLLISLFTDLAAHKNPKGDDKHWREMTQALLVAAKADDGKALKKAADCKACHDEHK